MNNGRSARHIPVRVEKIAACAASQVVRNNPLTQAPGAEIRSGRQLRQADGLGWSSRSEVSVVSKVALHGDSLAVEAEGNGVAL
ncbi:MAG: hypothetical protein HRT77_14530 [Halioglobus sp.]|nr:hypothetical protein [Halioglobus sp.]